MITKDVADSIRTMREVNAGYREIANALGLTRDQVRDFCRRYGLAGERGKRREKGEPKAPKEPDIITCEGCNTAFAAYRRGKRFCSEECRVLTRNRHANGLKSAERRARPHVLKRCKHCGQDFETNFHASRRVFCSKRCSKHQGKQDRDAMKRGQFVAPVYLDEVYERCGGKCALCGDPVDRTLVAPHLLSPTKDHIIPLALGGTHEPGNVQLAHFICNSRKGARIVQNAS